MAPRPSSEEVAHARTASREELKTLVHHPSEDVLAAVAENPQLDESHVLLLLERKDLPGTVVEHISRQKQWMDSYPVRLRMARHPRAPRLVALRLIKQLYLFDLVNVSLLPSVPAELKRIAEELILARLPQLPLGQKFALARRGSGRVAAALLAEGLGQVVPLALENAFLTEAHVLKVLAGEDLPPGVVATLAQHRKWSYLYNVRMALVRQPLTPLARVLSFLPDLTLGDLRVLSGARSLSPSLREYIAHEIEARSRRKRGAAPSAETAQDNSQ